MTINSNRRNDATGNDSLAVYPYGFKVFAATQIEVKVKKTSDGTITTLVYPTQFTVSNVGNKNGGNITLANVGGVWQNADGTLKTGYKISARRLVTVLQGTDIRNQGGFHADVHEDEFDYLTMIDLQQQDAIDRSVKLDSAFETAAFDMTLPAPVASSAIGFNAAGTGLAIISSLSGAATTAFTLSLLDDVDTEHFLDTLYASLLAETSPAIDDRLVLSDVSAGTWDYIELQHLLKVLNSLTADATPDESADYLLEYDASASVVKKVLIRDAASGMEFGQCRLTKSGANLLLSRCNGRRLFINGKWETIPSSGPTLAPPAVASTTYYIYAFMSAGVLTLENSVTAPAIDATYGHAIKTADATRTLVGMARTTAGNAWLDDATSCLVLSYFNRRRKAINNIFSANRTTTSLTYVEINTEIRANFLTWSDEAVSLSTFGTTNNSAASATATAIAIDSTTAPDLSGVSEGNTAAADGPMSLAFNKSGLSEGFHFATVVGSVSGGTGNWYGGAPAGATRLPFCALNAMVRG